jgi:glutamine amidotransferase
MGWNQLQLRQKNCTLFDGVTAGTNVYFCHSYYVSPTDPKIVAASTDYGIAFASAVFQNNIFGVQFHPEKSQDVGLKILKNFVKL